MPDREYDLAVVGATGFVGRLLAAHLAEHADPGLRIALAGRSADRLAATAEEIGGPVPGWARRTVDLTDPDTVAGLAQDARVVVTTAGPYRRLGLPLVQACAAAGTDYLDLTGEVLFIRDSIDRCHDAARDSGARIVHAAGFDSVPSDLGVLELHRAVLAHDAGELTDTTFALTDVRGGFSGGTVDSLRVQLAEMRADPAAAATVADPYALSPDRAAEPDLGDEHDLAGVQRDPELRMWLAPYVMAGINTRVVRRSNALQGWAYGRQFRYREVMGFPDGLSAPVAAAAVAGGVQALTLGMALPATRTLLDRLLPPPGAGPDERTRRNGRFRIEIHGRTTSGLRFRCDVAAFGDPGYAATAVMLGQAALLLAGDTDHRLGGLGGSGGVLTPATALGAGLADRLRAHGVVLRAAERAS